MKKMTEFQINWFHKQLKTCDKLQAEMHLRHIFKNYPKYFNLFTKHITKDMHI